MLVEMLTLTGAITSVVHLHSLELLIVCFNDNNLND